MPRGDRLVNTGERYVVEVFTSMGRLRDRLAEVRNYGYSISIEELYPGQVAAAVPIVAEGEAVGALGVSSTTVRATSDSLHNDVIPLLQEAAAAIGNAYQNANPNLFHAPL